MKHRRQTSNRMPTRSLANMFACRFTRPGHGHEYTRALTASTTVARGTHLRPTVEMSRRSQAATIYGPLFAGIVVVTIPTILLYFIFQRRLTAGLLSGAVRG